MIPLHSSLYKEIPDQLKKYDLKSTVSIVSGLLTIPSLQANTLRIETLVYLAVAHCSGSRKPDLEDIDRWVNRELGKTGIDRMEDPIEDVFITNIETSEGNRRLFEGIWQSNEYFCQVVLEILSHKGVPEKCRELLIPINALLKLSDEVADRKGLHRWHSEKSLPQGEVEIPSEEILKECSTAVTFSVDDLFKIGVSHEMLLPFILTEPERLTLSSQIVGHTSLENCPLLLIGDEFVLALPHAVSPAIRRFAIMAVARMGYLIPFARALAKWQWQQIEKECIAEIKKDGLSVSLPSTNKEMPECHTYLLKYDIDKYLHIIFLHGRIGEMVTEGLSGILQYPEYIRANFEEYLHEVAKHCKSISGYIEGMTLIVTGGLGRGLALEFESWPINWGLSVIRISDLLMLANGADQPFTKYLKFIKQKEWAEREGIRFVSANGDYQLYCAWQLNNFQLVHPDLPINKGTINIVDTDVLRPANHEIRKLSDMHCVETIDGDYVHVVRMGKSNYFSSMKDRPIYACLEPFSNGIFGGVVETERGTSWLLIEGNKDFGRLQYELWSGFIPLFDRLVYEVEKDFMNASLGVLAIHLNFKQFKIELFEISPGVNVTEPEVILIKERRIAEVIFPSDFSKHFQQPENTGERLMVRAVTKGLISLHHGDKGIIEERVIDELVNRTIIGNDVRILHMFQTYYPIEELLARQDMQPTLLAKEDFVFSKLKLSYGLTSVKPGSIISGKSECVNFLNAVVEKIWKEIHGLLQLYDRSSVIREVYLVLEAALKDRIQWRRTARAVLSMYNFEDDVADVAGGRDKQRSQISIAARTILEMAICECPLNGGRRLSKWGRDELFAKATLLFEVASESDAVKNGLAKAEIELYHNGDYNLDRSFFETVIQPFVSTYLREDFGHAAKDYDKHYQQKSAEERKQNSDLFSPNFVHAFHSEFGITPWELIDGMAALMDIAVEQDNVMVETTIGDLRSKFVERNTLTSETAESFLMTLSLFSRPEWDKAPEGFSERDIYPWRFKRRLSVTSRPILAFGLNDDDKIFYGAGTLKLGVTYLLDRSEEGALPQKYFMTTKMREYLGTVSNERGHAFAKSVAGKMRNQGWNARSEINMTALEADSELGDIDVLAWKESGEILLIECKRLQLAKTINEIAELCKRFRGEAKDDLDKHIRRINWIKRNPESLRHIVGFAPDLTLLDHRLITNTHVPMMYLQSLPIEAKKIGPMDRLAF